MVEESVFLVRVTTLHFIWFGIDIEGYNYSLVIAAAGLDSADHIYSNLLPLLASPPS